MVSRLSLSVLLSVTLGFSPPAAAQEQDYDDVVTDAAESDDGLFSVHRVDDQLLFEIPDSLLGRDMIVMSRYHRVQEGQTNVGANMAPGNQ